MAVEIDAHAVCLTCGVVFVTGAAATVILGLALWAVESGREICR